MVDSKQHIWIAFYNNGIEAYTKTGALYKSYNTSNSGLSKDIVLCMTEKGGQIWVGTDGGGINLIEH